MKILSLFLLLCGGMQLFGGGMTLEEAVQASKTNGKPVLIDFYAVWCGPCKQFKKASVKDSDIKALLGKVNLVMLDAEKGEGKVQAEKFNVKGYPTYVLANSELESIYRFSGYEKAYFTEKLNEGLSDLRTIDAKLAHLKSHPEDSQLAANMADFYRTQGMNDKALAFFEQAEKYSKEKTYVAEMFSTRYSEWRRGQVKHSLSDMQGFAKRVFDSKKLGDADKMHTANFMADYCNREKLADDQKTYISKGLKYASNMAAPDDYAQQVAKKLKIDEALLVSKDVAKAVELKKSTLAENWMNNADQLNNFSWWCFQNGVNLEEAASLAEKGVSISEAGKQKANVYDTLAEIQFARGKTDLAISAIKKAIEENPSNDHFKKQLERFKKAAANNAS